MDYLMDATYGNLGGNSKPKHGDYGGGASDNQGNKPPLVIIMDYKLSQSILVPTSDWDSTLV